MRKQRATSLVEAVGKDSLLVSIAKSMTEKDYSRRAYKMVLEVAESMGRNQDSLPRRPRLRSWMSHDHANPAFRGNAHQVTSADSWRMRIRPPVLSTRGPALTLG